MFKVKQVLFPMVCALHGETQYWFFGIMLAILSFILSACHSHWQPRLVAFPFEVPRLDLSPKLPCFSSVACSAWNRGTNGFQLLCSLTACCFPGLTFVMNVQLISVGGHISQSKLTRRQQWCQACKVLFLCCLNSRFTFSTPQVLKGTGHKEGLTDTPRWNKRHRQ